MSLSSIKVNNSTAININNQLKGDDQLISDSGVSKEFDRLYIGSKSETPQYITLGYDDIVNTPGYLSDTHPYAPTDETTTDSIWNTIYINIEDIKENEITFYGRIFNMCVFYYDRNKVFLDEYGSHPSGYESPEVTKEITFNAPSDAHYVRFNLSSSELSSYVKFAKYEIEPTVLTGVSIQISQIEDNVLRTGSKSGETQQTSVNGWDYNPQPGYITSSGGSGEGFNHTEDYIDISKRTNNTLTYEGYYFSMTLFAYNENKSFIQMIPIDYSSDEYATHTFTVEDDVYYLKINLMTGYDSILTFTSYKTSLVPLNGIQITTSQISDYTPGGGGGGEAGTFSVKYKISKALYALGDSVTCGVGDTSEAGGWAQRLSNKISFTNFYKYAVSGSTSMHGARGWLSQQIARIPQNSTDFIVVMIGTNDCNLNYTVGDVDAALAKSYASLDPTADFSESFRSDMESLKRRCPLATIVFVLPVSNSTVTEPRMENFLEVMRKVCAALSIPVLETRDEVGIPQRLNLGMASTWMSDGLHPGPNGHELVATYVAGYLMRYADQVILS